MASRITTGEHVAQFVSQRIGVALCPPYTTLGLERDGLLVGGCIFNCWEGTDVHITAAGTGWTRGFLRAVGDYVFRQLGCLRFTMETEKPEVAEYAKRLGGVVEGRLRDHFGEGRDAIIIGVLRRDWKFGIKEATERR